MKYVMEKSQAEMDDVSVGEVRAAVTDFGKTRVGPCVRSIRGQLGMSQRAFAATFGIPLTSLRNWERKRAQPDTAAQNYLKVIAFDAETVRNALETDKKKFLASLN